MNFLNQQLTIMGIVNATPDSFYKDSRAESIDICTKKAEQMLKEGADIIDIGGFSTRPNHTTISEEEEKARVLPAVCAIRNSFPNAILSIDTFRSEIAKEAVEKYQVNIINDISGGLGDSAMFDTVGQLHTTYILSCNRQSVEQYLLSNGLAESSDYISAMIGWFGCKIEQLQERGITEIIIDPAIGFHNDNAIDFAILQRLTEFRELKLPLLVGVSRKSMIYKTLDTTPTNSLNGTTILNSVAFLNGASILRVHDIKAAAELRLLMQRLQKVSTNRQ